MFNRREELALLLLGGALLLGGVLAVAEYRREAALEEFRVIARAVEPPPATSGEQAPIPLNQATAAQLVELPGVGPKTAARIVEFRREYGPFASLEELGRVRGIGARTLEKLRPLVVVE